MKLTLCSLLLSLAYIAYAVPIEEPAVAYPRHIQFADGDGVVHDVDLEDEIDEELLADVAKNNIYLLFTRRNPDVPEVLVINDAASIRNSLYDPTLPTVVIAHSWFSNQNAGMNARIKEAHLGKDDVNVIILDWSRLARSNYITAVRGVPAVGRGLGAFIRFLVQVTGARLDNFHLVGFSVGAHLVGNAGRELEGKVARVTGLDPAGPLWNLNSNRLSSGDARYVEAIHTNGDLEGLGIGYAIADADFFPNGGNSQPGCLTFICHHNRAWEFYASTVTNNHLIARRCSNLLQIALNLCRGTELHMGNDDLNKYGEGRYRVNTRRRYPY